MIDWSSMLSWTAAVFGICSAAAWLRSSTVKVTVEEAMSRRKRTAERTGITLSHGYTSLDGWEMSETFAAQSRWNSLGAFLAASSITLQAISQLVGRA